MVINIHQIISNVDVMTQHVSFSHGYTTLSMYLHTAAFTFLHQFISKEINVGKRHLLPQIIGKIIAKYENRTSL